MHPATKKPPNNTVGQIEAMKRNIRETKEAIETNGDPFMKPILTQLLKEQTRHLTDLETIRSKTPMLTN